MVAYQGEIQTLSYQKKSTPLRLIWDCSTEFEISDGSRKERGTDIILHINADSEEFLNKARLQEILSKYGSFLPVPIKFGTKTTSEPDGEDEEGKPKYKSVEVDNIINNIHPAWTKSPSELKRSEEHTSELQ